MLKEQKLIDLLLFHGPMGADEFIKGSGLSRSAFYRTTKKLISNGMVEKIESVDGMTTRVLYNIIPGNIPAVIAQDFRWKVEALVEGIKEFSSSREPDKTQAFETFVESGIFDFGEMMDLKRVYQMSWEDLAFLMPKKSGMDVSPGEISMMLKSKASNPDLTLSPKMEHKGVVKSSKMELSEEFSPEMGGCPNLGLEVFGLKDIYNTIKNIRKSIYKADGVESHFGTPDPISFVKVFKSLFQGFLFDLPDVNKKTLSSDPKRFGEMMLKVLFDEPAPSDEKKGPISVPDEKKEISPASEVEAMKKPPRKKVSFAPPKWVGEKKETLPVKLTRSSAISKEDERMAEGRMHPNYWGLDPYERDFEFAKIYVDLIGRGSEHRRKMYEKVLGTESMYRFRRPRKKNCVEDRKSIHASRVQADNEGARYDEWIKARIETWSPERNFNVPYPSPHYLTSRENWEVWCGFMTKGNGKDYITYDRTGLEAIGIPCLLPENFHANGHLEKVKAKAGDPSVDQKKLREYDLQCKLYEDYIYLDMMRVHSSSGWDILDVIKKAIRKKIIPADWVMGYGTHHNLPELKSAKYLIK